ncbi:hypothetical protein SCHPADRAFT_510753 [Schizopora paradoxa]|uniref:Uncharacterized protein n=1 Tax=Schizopora paradoxa TaxID=27342 RepID=A0A0H2RFG1_9AGAM|nr:hypothetical protein SCHPADRAFT_510753 [Schizopora paradoxa]
MFSLLIAPFIVTHCAFFAVEVRTKRVLHPAIEEKVRLDREYHINPIDYHKFITHTPMGKFIINIFILLHCVSTSYLMN